MIVKLPDGLVLVHRQMPKKGGEASGVLPGGLVFDLPAKKGGQFRAHFDCRGNTECDHTIWRVLPVEGRPNSVVFRQAFGRPTHETFVNQMDVIRPSTCRH